jgi:FG-GAP-like repeat/TPR repeat/ASPIC and UnbV
MLQQSLNEAREYLGTARDLSPANGRIEFLLGEVETRAGRLPEAIEHLTRATELDPANAKALYALADQVERRAGVTSDRDAQLVLDRLLEAAPGNLEALLQASRLAAKRGDAVRLRSLVGRVSEQSASWPSEAREQLEELERAAAGSEPGEAANRVLFLRNVLQRLPVYRTDADQVLTPAASIPEPLRGFILLPSPDAEPADADLTTSFVPEAIPGVPASGVAWVRPVYLDDTGVASILWADNSGLHVGNAGIPAASGPGASVGPSSVAPADLDYDFLTDLVIAGPAGLTIYMQRDGGAFVDVTSASGLNEDVIGRAYSSAWPFDSDLDGDLDVVLAGPDSAPMVLRNNGDGTYAVGSPFQGVSGAVAFVAADLDGDGDPDPALVGADGAPHVFTNERLGQYRERAVPSAWTTSIRAVAAGDVGGDGTLDLVVLSGDGRLGRLTDQNGTWAAAELASGVPIPADAGNAAGQPAALVLADFDNNGSLDILAGDSRVLLSTGAGFVPLEIRAAGADVVDLNRDGLLDLVGLADGPVALINQARAGYGWQTIRTRAANAQGDQRINSFGLGGEIELRSGLLTQKQVISVPVLHFGLGDRTGTDVARIVWPNGLVQVEFDLGANAAILAEQRIKGSCPSLFAWNGSEFVFVKDAAPWSPALGLYINAQEVAGIYQTEEWFRIPGSQLVPSDGYYELRVTAELWETYYIDHYSLLIADHPEDISVYSDERFAVPPPPLQLYATSQSHPFVSATDTNGRDVRATLGAVDGAYLDTFPLGQYQGVAADHWVELELPPEAPRDGPLYLIGDGWVHPTDATVNVALGQGGEVRPEGLRIEVPDEAGVWQVARDGLGFPAGKKKTVVLDLTGIFLPDAPRRFRMRTNMEIYWDRLAWARGAEDSDVRVERVSLEEAELRPRGFSEMRSGGPSSPEIPVYDRIAGTSQRWQDLSGYYTRYGDVRELLEDVDDRILIVNAGDEIRLRFPVPPPPPEGWTRDFVMIGDGWIKDGDYNSLYSRTVLPLPYHAMTDYRTPPGRLEDDPAYRMHPFDWQRFHTRYVTPEPFRQAWRP